MSHQAQPAREPRALVRRRIEQVRGRLAGLDYRLTPQREAVLSVFMQRPNTHLSAEEVYLATKEVQPDIGLATVYRALELFEKLGILHKLDDADGQSRFEFTEGDGHYHHHLICFGCGKIIHYMNDLLEPVEARIERETGFSIVDHSLRFFGYCSDCSGEER
ncbi:MAG TPA: Fur family transcriptional regulator [Limnochordia bacterium]